MAVNNLGGKYYLRGLNEYMIMTLKISLILCLLCISGYKAVSQEKEIKLAQEYVSQGEMQKAKAIYQKLAKEPANSRTVYSSYLEVLINLKEWKEAEMFIKKQIKSSPQVIYRLDYGWLLEKQGKAEESEKYYQKIIQEEKNDPERVAVIAEYFSGKNNWEQAEKTYLAARGSGRSAFALPLADIYGRQGKSDMMIEEYLNLALELKNNNLEEVKNALQENIRKEEDFEKLEKVLISRVQKNPSEITYSELLMWYYLQQKDFNKAFLQARAIDKRQKLEGVKIVEIGLIAMNNKDYKAAATIFEYLTNTYPQSTYYPVARRYLINAKEELVKSVFPVDINQIQSLVQDYRKLINEVGRNNRSMEAIRSMGVLYGFYLDQKDSAVQLLQEAIKMGVSDPNFVGKCKMDLGDVYLLKNEPWESTLLYSQVEKELKEQTPGYEAKLRNAKLSYYKGDFELAKSHLNVLKLATSREISNDAIQLSLLITDNLVQDTTGAALKEYAATELLLFQNKTDEALQKLQSVISKYENNSLTDEILWLEANIHLRRNENEKAIENLEIINTRYSYDIFGDDAYFLTAKIYEEKLNRKEKAMEMYRSYLEKFPGSIYVTEARKRFRLLRGDKVN
jgi:tetratricopeptide (TPR) repeat protein